MVSFAEPLDMRTFVCSGQLILHTLCLGMCTRRARVCRRTRPPGEQARLQKDLGDEMRIDGDGFRAGVGTVRRGYGHRLQASAWRQAVRRWR